ncbi:MAG: hypothetical protein ACJAWT_001220 [Glaciecola sp.]|jgi:hypothetical protein
MAYLSESMIKLECITLAFNYFFCLGIKIMTSKSIKVCDLFIQFIHWTMVVTILTRYVTEGETNLHFYSG